MNILSLASHQLRHAANLIDKIEKLKKELAAAVGSSVATEAPKIRRKLSDAGRLAIAAAQKARWSKVKSIAKPARRKMNAAARAKIAAAARKRWAKAKAAGKKSL